MQKKTATGFGVFAKNKPVTVFPFLFFSGSICHCSVPIYMSRKDEKNSIRAVAAENNLMYKVHYKPLH